MYGRPGWHFWLIGFALTLLLEAPWVLSLLARVERRWSERLILLLLANLLTHPLVWFFFPGVPLRYPAALTVSELWAFGGEVAFYTWALGARHWRLSVAISFLANLTSFSVGWLVVTRFRSFLFAL